MDALQIALILLITGAGSLLQGMVGLGLNLMAAPLLMMVDARFVPGPVIVAGLAQTVLMVLRERGGIDLRAVTWMAAGMLPGTVLASLLLPVIPVKTLSLLLGGLVLLGVGLTVSGLRFAPKRRILAAAGFVSGVGSTLASIGGPPVALVNQEMEPNRLRATLSAYFIIAAVCALLGMIPAGRLGAAELKLSLVMLPGIVVGFLASIPLAKRVSRRFTRSLVLGLSAVSAVVLIVQQLAKP